MVSDPVDLEVQPDCASRFAQCFYNNLYLHGSEEFTFLAVSDFLQAGIQRGVGLYPVVPGVERRTDGKIRQVQVGQFALRIGPDRKKGGLQGRDRKYA